MSWKFLINQQNFTKLFDIVGFVQNVPFKAVCKYFLIVFVHQVHFDRNVVLFLLVVRLDC
jgi:hypothetical protein